MQNTLNETSQDNGIKSRAIETQHVKNMLIKKLIKSLDPIINYAITENTVN